MDRDSVTGTPYFLKSMGSPGTPNGEDEFSARLMQYETSHFTPLKDPLYSVSVAARSAQTTPTTPGRSTPGRSILKSPDRAATPRTTTSLRVTIATEPSRKDHPICESHSSVKGSNQPGVTSSFQLLCASLKTPMTQWGALVFVLGWASLAMATQGTALFFSSAAMMLGASAVGFGFFQTYNEQTSRSNVGLVPSRGLGL